VLKSVYEAKRMARGLGVLDSGHHTENRIANHGIIVLGTILARSVMVCVGHAWGLLSISHRAWGYR
jgi:hypothetical protein